METNKEILLEKVFKDLVKRKKKTFSSSLLWLMTLSLEEIQDIEKLPKKEHLELVFNFVGLTYELATTLKEENLMTICDYFNCNMRIDYFRRLMLIDVMDCLGGLKISSIVNKKKSSLEDKKIKEVEDYIKKLPELEFKVGEILKQLVEELEEEEKN